MLPLPVGREASLGVAAPPYVRHRQEHTLLYQLVEEYYPSFEAHLAAQGETLPGYVDQEFEAYLKCGRLEHGFLRARCDSCHAEHLVAFSCKKRGFCPSCGARRMAESAALLVDEVFPEQPVPKALAALAGQALRQWVLNVPYPLRFLFASRPDVMGRVLGIVYRCIATHLIKKAGFTCKTARSGVVTLIQRFGSALNFNVHFHMLFLDGVYVERPDGRLRFRWVKAPTSAELNQLARRIGQYLERQGLLERDAENSYLAGDDVEDGAMAQLLGSSITYIVSPWLHSGAARCSPCRRCRPVKSHSITGLARWRGFRCMPVCRPGPMSARNLNGCAAQQSDIHQLNDTNKDLVDISIRNSDRLTTLVNDILDMARIASGRFALESKPVNAMQTLIDTLELNTPYCKKCNVQTKISTTTGKDLSIHADEKRIQQVLGNLISNASKFTHQGDTLELLLSEDSAHHQAVFSVTNHGPGIPAEEIPSLFNRFHQIAENNNNKVAGTGLGLNICKQIVELHGGGLWVESEPNVKTTFCFSIPLADGTLLSFSPD